MDVKLRRRSEQLGGEENSKQETGDAAPSE
jgi:hypothetical protein